MASTSACPRTGFGTDFSLPDEDAPRGHTVSLLMSDEQASLWREAMDGVGKVEGGGNDGANRICEVIRQWMALRA